MANEEFRKYVRRSAFTNFVFNLALNAGLAWWLLSSHELLTPWGDASYGTDLLLTGFLLSALVAAIVMEIHRRKALRGDMDSAPLVSRSLKALSRQNRWVASVLIGSIGAGLSALVLVAIAGATDSPSVPAYAGLKGLWAGFLAAAIIGPATLLGLDLGARQRAQR